MSDKKDESPGELTGVVISNPQHRMIPLTLSPDELLGLTLVWKLEDAYRVLDNMGAEMRKQVLNSYCAKCGMSKRQTVTDLRTSMFRVFAQCNCEG